MKLIKRPTVLDLFSGIGGFHLAFSRAGFRTVAFSEIEAYPSRVLAERFPFIPNLGDIRKIDASAIREKINVVCGGFPCQDISVAGKGAGLDGERSGLWFEMLRIIRGTRPAFCLIENVPSLRTRGADTVLSNLEEAGYAARAFVVGAWSVRAQHKRDRVWIVAYSQRAGLEKRQRPEIEWTRRATSGDSWRVDPSGMGRIVNGFPARSHRIKALGNAIVPQVAYPFAAWMKDFFK